MRHEEVKRRILADPDVFGHYKRIVREGLPSWSLDFDVTLARSEDWEALYVNGFLRAEGQTLSAEDVLDALRITYDFMDIRGHDFHVLPYEEDDLRGRMEELDEPEEEYQEDC